MDFRLLLRLSLAAVVRHGGRKGRAAVSLPSVDLSDREGQARVRTNTEQPTFGGADSLYVELVLVADNSMYRKYDGDRFRLRTRLAEIVSVVNALYWPLNISVALTGVEIWNQVEKISVVSDPEATLRNFLKYRREDLLLRLPNDCAYLVTTSSFQWDVVGKALKGKMCTHEFSGGIVNDHSESPGLVAATLAHELGHNFGMEHDYTDCECPEDRCIMTPASTGSKPSSWSSCSRNYLEDHLVKGIGSCLKNRPTIMLDEGKPFCGNGFQEEGEECDCGPVEFCKTVRCVPETCRLSKNCTCGHGACCNVATCNLKPGAVVCRPPKSECDLTEYCSGATESCPPDVWKADGIKCRSGQAFCFNGECHTAADQCRKLWGKTGAVADNKCFETNIAGSTSGHCGHDRVLGSYSRCPGNDVKCGLLHCTTQADRLALGTDGSAMISEQFISAGPTHISCKAAYVDVRLSIPDPGMVPGGAKCAKDSMCYNFACHPIAHLPNIPCPRNCSGAGVCNNLGHCHCHDGYAPPDCSGSGYGGSVYSGPVANTSSRGTLSTAMLIVSVLVLLVALTAIFSYFTRYRIRGWIRATYKRLQEPPKPCLTALVPAFIQRSWRTSPDMPAHSHERQQNNRLSYCSSESIIPATPDCPQGKNICGGTHPLPDKPPRMTESARDHPATVSPPDPCPPSSSTLVSQTTHARNHTPGKPARPAPRPPFATNTTRAVTKTTARVKQPLHPRGLSAGVVVGLEACSTGSPQRSNTLVAEMARRFETSKVNSAT